jgi:20S proteasome subunit alpha 2
MIFMDDLMPIHSISREVANLMQEYTQSGGVRPFGVCMFLAGCDRDGNHLYQVDPSGAYYGMNFILYFRIESRCNWEE